MSAAQPGPKLIAARSLAGNTVWNLLGQLLPMAAALVAVPPLVSGLSVPRFGVLSLILVVIGYFGLLDLGIGSALTKMVADHVGARRETETVPLVWTSLFLMLLLGALGGLGVLALSPWLVHRVLKVPPSLQDETLRAFYLMSLSVPSVTLTSGLRGILEGLQRFRAANLIRIPMSIFSYAGALLVLPFSRSLVWVVAVLALSRAVGCLIYLWACLRAWPGLRGRLALEPRLVRPVVIFGGWMTVSNVINPILVYADRFVVGAMVSVTLTAFYTVPFDVVVRLLVIPGAIAGVLFPAFAFRLAQDPYRAEVLFSRSLKYIVLSAFPVALIAVTLAPEGLQLWLGASFTEKSTPVLRWLAAGVFVNSLAHIPFALVQSAGRPDITAKLHLLELPLYLVAVWALTRTMGIEGTAIAWAGRLTLDTLLIAFVIDRVLWPHKKSLLKIGAVAGGGLLLLGLATLPATLTMKLTFLGLILTGFVLTAWFLVLNREERVFLVTPRNTERL
ncbi:MAG TPA: flippase [Candidatus Angelobacter sp.]